MQKSAALEVQEITRLYKSSWRGVADVSFEARPGKVFGLMVPNGSVLVRL